MSTAAASQDTVGNQGKAAAVPSSLSERITEPVTEVVRIRTIRGEEGTKSEQCQPMDVIPALEIVNPLPPETVQVTPSSFDVQLKGPTLAV
ncbi:hypothetical protein MAAFP003_74 [Mycobacterium ahvazicum]|uniref:Uncharacterized protein n=1 Tax=Mycobacterium ahvazicum TaxID=1964395 RepID=A0A2K4Y3P9_9MYCO|nr:hypothetical protein MAAFP003_74 [Mycobacterium ahvazicum]